MQSYQSGVRKIPTACISIEDAELMARLSSRGTKIVLTLKMEAKTYPDADSFNTVAEIVGSKYPEQHDTKRSVRVGSRSAFCCVENLKEAQQ
uniref:Uncharacterized protein n=1 Tax=Sphaerodactylus townsendi TaxID=933632 RepID=A0ACB8FFG9_9SAUR